MRLEGVAGVRVVGRFVLLEWWLFMLLVCYRLCVMCVACLLGAMLMGVLLLVTSFVGGVRCVVGLMIVVWILCLVDERCMDLWYWFGVVVPSGLD